MRCLSNDFNILIQTRKIPDSIKISCFFIKSTHEGSKSKNLQLLQTMILYFDKGLQQFNNLKRKKNKSLKLSTYHC